MKHWLLVFLVLQFLSVSLQGQVQAQDIELSPSDGGEYIFNKTECLSEAEREVIAIRLDANRQALLQLGLLNENKSPIIALFDWPVTHAPALGYNNTWGISNYVDHGAGTTLDDYDCGTRTYDGHKGIDIFTWPFPWYLKNNNLVHAVAAAPGTIIGKDDGNVDDHCTCSGNWNAVYVEHADGSVAWYGHLKLGSLTPKNIGETVSTGEYLGVVASSGCSTGPHLHFEIYKDQPYTNSNLIDPYAGPCNLLNVVTWWNDQPDYRKPTINAVLTHSATPIHGCPSNNEDPKFKDIFLPGQTVYTNFYYKDQMTGTTANYQLLRPNGTVYNSWMHNFTNTFNASWWQYTWNLPVIGPFGTWTVTATYNGLTVSHEFQYLQNLPVLSGVGINTLDPVTELHVHDGALFIDNADKGIIIKGENGSCYKISVNVAGNLIAVLMPSCPN